MEDDLEGDFAFILFLLTTIVVLEVNRDTIT